MRLHRLRLSAFLAFAGTEEVDFDALGQSGLFLLQGRTGAGKTSLLDAVCFAFYGEVPGAREDGARLRSDHAAADLRTEVTLEATLRGRRVRITRSPEQERPKVRGEGTTTEPHRVQVVAIEPGGGQTVLATRHDEARSELADLLGLTREQFCQVVLLPQGGFAKFLQARSDERENLLRELFDVGRFASVERWLKERKADTHQAAALAMQGVAEVVARAAQVAGADMPDGWEAEPDALPDWLERQRVVAEASAATAEEACAEAGRRREVASAELVDARRLAGLQQERRAALAELDAWQDRRSERDAAAAELAAARRAAPARALVEALESRTASANESRASADAALQAVADASLEIPVRTPAALRDAAGELRRAAGSAEAVLECEHRLDETEREIRKLEDAATRHAETAAAQRALVEAADRRRASLEAALQAARGAAARLPGAETVAEEARTRAAQAAERDRLLSELDPARRELLSAREAAVRARQTHLDLLSRRLAGMAAALADELADGEPCAVCGSTEHPRPAAAPAAGLVDETAVSAAEAHANECEERRDQAAEEVERLQRSLAGARAVAGEVPAAELEAAAARAAAERDELRRQAAGAEAAELALAEADAAREAAARTCGEAEVAAAAARAEARERAAGLAQDRAAVDAARHGAKTIAGRVAGLSRAAEAADAAAAALEQALVCEREAERAAARAAEAARDAGFRNLETLSVALRDADECDRLESVVREWDEGLSARRAAATRDELTAAASRPAPDLAALEVAAAEALAAAESAQHDVATARARRSELQHLQERLEEALGVAGPTRRRAELVREVADLAAGTSASNRKRMRLSAYVLAARLEEVAAAATVRLRRMSDGRYSLEHSDDPARRTRRSGLELRVVDAWTGRDRPPSSLSGGETFLASLALALGLADVVTAEAGGARLETLFVDEGFGSLDDEGTLDEVIAVLDGLRDGGRAVGIVSHVAELRQRIPVQLRVEKGRAGSHLVPAA